MSPSEFAPLSGERDARPLKAKIAFLFVVDTDPQFPRSWDRYFASHEARTSVYVCARNARATRWRREALVELAADHWDSVGAYLALFAEALKDPANTRFITVSASCLPMRPFAELYAYLQSSPDSLVMRLTAVHADFDPARIDSIMEEVGDLNIIKHRAQMALSRAHVQKLAGTGTVDVFRDMALGGEYFLSAISPMRNVRQFELTHDDRRYIEGRMQTVKDDIRLLSLAARAPGGRGRTAELLSARDDIADDLADLRIKYSELASVPQNDDTVSDGGAATLRGVEAFFYRRFDEHANIDAYIYAFLKDPVNAD